MSSPSSPHLFVFGLGYSGGALARCQRQLGWRVGGTIRKPQVVTALLEEGIETILIEEGEASGAASDALAETTHLLSTVPPDAEGDPILRHYGAAIAAAPRLSWIGYLSTTGVYGDHGGGWVEEDTPPAPTSERSRRRLTAEQAWLSLQQEERGPSVQIFRLAGIYGRGRTPRAALRAGRARRIVKPGQVFGRIHLDDIVSVLQASMAQPSPGAIYNVSDDEPADPAAGVAYAADLLGLEPPPAIPFEEADLSPLARSFYADSRRVSNRRIKEELGVTLAHPRYREGLIALEAQGRDKAGGRDKTAGRDRA